MEALANISGGVFSAPGSTGFGVFVLDRNGTIIADALKPGMVGYRFDGKVASSMVAQFTLLKYIDWVVSWGGGWVPHFTTRLVAGEVNPSNIPNSIDATAYIEACPSGERLGVAFSRELIPAIERCNPSANGFCAIQNINRMVGGALVEFLNSKSAEDLVRLDRAAGLTTKYSVGKAFYTWRCELNWFGFPGPKPLRNPSHFDDNAGTLWAHGGLPAVLNGRNLSVIGGTVDGIDRGTYLQIAISRGAWIGGSWADYLWSTPALGPHHKVTLSVGGVWNNTASYIGAGAVHLPEARAKGPVCEECTAVVSLPCSIVNCKILSAHAQLEFLMPTGTWSRVSNDKWFGAMHANAHGEQYAGTWPVGFYVTAFDYNGTCVADGFDPSNIGKHASEVFVASPDQYVVHAKRILVADAGGGWIAHTLSDKTKHISFVNKLTKHSRFFYTAVSYTNTMAAVAPRCSSSYAEPCSERQAQALLGKVATEILSAALQTDLVAVLGNISARTGPFDSSFTGDFVGLVYDSTWRCPDIVAASGIKCPPGLSPEFLYALSPVELDGGWISVVGSELQVARKAFVVRTTYSALGSSAYRDFLLLTFVTDTPAPPTCSSDAQCPQHGTCPMSGRCSCRTGFRADFNISTTMCGQLPLAAMTCVDVRGLDCSEVVARGSATCPPCKSGHFCPEGVPLACPVGQYCPLGSATPQLCSPGTRGTETLATSEESCKACLAGTSQARGGQTECLACEKGTMTDLLGSASCARCEFGYFQDVPGSTFCKLCPYSMITESRGGTSLADCVCPSGTYKPLTSSMCMPCPHGMVCKVNSTEGAFTGFVALLASGFPAPQVVPGYMTLAAHPLDPYRCLQADRCSGGGPGTCAEGRDPSSIACAECLPNMHEGSDGRCIPCKGGDGAVPVTIGILAVVLGLCFMAWMVNRNILAQHNSVTSCGIILGLLLVALQTMSVYSSLSIRWVSPLDSFFRGLSIFSLNIGVAFNTGCVVGAGPVAVFSVRQVLAPGFAVIMLIAVALKKIIWRRATQYWIESINTIGTVYSTLFVSIVMSAVQPWVCYEHPNDNGLSMLESSGVLCFETSEHTSMVTLGVAAILIVVLPFVALILWANLRYRTSVKRGVSDVHIRTFRFLFVRYHPQYYFFSVVTLFRGLFICLVPVVARGFPEVQTLLMCAVMLSYNCLVTHIKPWRGSATNAIDGALANILVVVLMCAAMTTTFDNADAAIGSLGLAACVIFFASGVAAIALALHRRLFPRPFYSNFVCHHKGEAAAQARFLQIELSERTGTTVFIDSDHLTNLDGLFDIVRCRIGRLVVFLTSETLRRRWCAGEISITFSTHKSVFVAKGPTFRAPPADELVEDKIETFLAPGVNLAGYGIVNGVISRAFCWMLSDEVKSFSLDAGAVGLEKFRSLAHILLAVRAKPVKLTAITNRTSCGVTLISSVRGYDEATAAVGILMSKTKGHDAIVAEQMLAMCDLPVPSDIAELRSVVVQGSALVVMLSAGSMESEEQLRMISLAVGAQISVVPVALPCFRFPPSHFFTTELPNRVPAEVVAHVETFFKLIAVPLRTYESAAILTTEVASVVARLKAAAKSKRDRRGEHGASGGGCNAAVQQAVPAAVGAQAMTPSFSV